MRPLKLRMSAFGPYTNEAHLDLESLGTSGVYLITGDTGAGKTTIFDGIVYALYGKPSGANRDEGMLRSKNASPSTPTEVELEFSCKGNTYKILRSPTYSRLKKSGEGLTSEPARVELHLPSGRVITNTKEANAEVEGIIGLSRDQFLQIAMIAQGEFLKLLFASTDDRIKIFQKIFKTKPYELLQIELSNKARELGIEHERARQSIGQYINGIQIKEASPYEGELQMAKNDSMPIIDVVDLIKKLIELDTCEKKELEGELEATENQITKASNNLNSIEACKKSKEQLEKNKERLMELEPRLELAKKEFDEQRSEQRKAEKRELDKEIAQMDVELEGHKELKNITTELAEVKEEILSLDALIKATSEQIEALRDEISKLENEQSSLKDTPEKRARLEAKRSDLEEKQRRLRALASSLDDREEKSKELEKSRKEYLKLSEISQNAQLIYIEKHRAFLNEQAGVLAHELKDGEPCIVCGSIHHPSPAVKTQNAPSKQELEQYERQKQDAIEREQIASRSCERIGGTLQEQARKLQGELNEYFATEVELDNARELILSAQDAIMVELEAIVSQIEELDVGAKRLKALDEAIPTKKKSLEDVVQSLADSKSKKASCEASAIALEKRQRQIQGELKYESEEQAKSAKSSCVQRQEALVKAYDNAESTFNDLNSEHIALTASIKELKEQLSTTKEFDEEKEKQALALAKEKKAELNTRLQDATSRISQNSFALAEINKKIDYVSKLDEKYAWVKALADTANGTLVGKEKIKLETYIQMAYFDRIIRRANLRLLKMTSGQYELKRKADENTRRGQCGLDLDVCDHYTGTERSVKTLSGGESFKASLSLALGLAEEIQSSAGGVQIDTMFVDEGFGSLDEESLDQAMNALTSLSDGNRLVGIISHVSELKNRIEKQIVITKDKLGGSTAKIVL